MANDDFYREWWKHVEGHRFRRKRGRVPHVAETMLLDYAYAAHYHFVRVLVKLRNENTGRNVWVEGQLLKHEWVEVKDS